MWYKPWDLKWAFKVKKKANDILVTPTPKAVVPSLTWAVTIPSSPATPVTKVSSVPKTTKIATAGAKVGAFAPKITKVGSLSKGGSASLVVSPKELPGVINSGSSQNARAKTNVGTPGLYNTSTSTASTPIARDFAYNNPITADMAGKTGKATNLNTQGLNYRWQEASAKESTSAWFTKARNRAVANNLIDAWTVGESDVRNYLWWQTWFSSASPQDQQNTVNNILSLIWGGTPTTGTTPPTTGTIPPATVTWPTAWQSFDYTSQLSSIFTQGMGDKSAIYNEMMKNPSFAAFDSATQNSMIQKISNDVAEMKSAKEKADMTNAAFDPVEYAKQKGFELTGWDGREIKEWRKEIMATLNHKGTIYDNNIKDWNTSKDAALKKINDNLEGMKIQTNRQIEDVSRQAQETINMGEKVGALKWYGKSGGYVSGLATIQEESDRTIARLKSDFARAESLTGDEKDMAIQAFSEGIARAKEQFDYDMRDVVAEGNIELSKVVMGKYDPAKLGKLLDQVAYDVIDKRLNIESKYIANIRANNDLVTQQFDQFKSMDEYTNNQRKEFTTLLNANNGEALGSMSGKDIQDYVDKGYLSQEQGIGYYNAMVSKSIGALSQYGQPTQQDIDGVIASIKGGVSPLQAIAKVMQSNPNRFKADIAKQFMSVGKDSSIFDTISGKFINQGGGDTSENESYNGPTVAPVTNKQIDQWITDFVGKLPVGGTIETGECWVLVNRYLSSIGVKRSDGKNMFIDPIDVRKMQANSSTPEAWSVAIFDNTNNPNASQKWKEFWHVAIVRRTKGVWDWMIEIIDQNSDGKWKIAIRTVPASSVYGYFDPALGLGGQEWNDDLDMKVLSLTQWLGGTAGERDQFAQNILKKAKKDGIPLQEAKKKLGYKSGDDIEFAKSRKEQLGAITKNNDTIKNGRQALTVLNSPQTSIGDVASIVWFLKVIDPNSVARESEVESVESARGTLDSLSNTFAKLDSWKKLTTEQRKQLIETIGIIVKAYESNLTDFVSETKQEFDDRGLDSSVYIPKGIMSKYGTKVTNTSWSTTPAIIPPANTTPTWDSKWGAYLGWGTKRTVGNK